MAKRKSAGAPLALFHPLVRTWFTERVGMPSPPQRLGWPVIASGAHTLLLAPTGTGKTLAAFLYELDALIRRGIDAPLPNSVQLLYVSPLKALNNDIQRNLELPLTELRARFEAEGKVFPEIRVAVRTGDTPASARARMLRRAPHILITTPESLHIMLTTLRGRGMFSGTRAVILDEIHAVAGTKRGAHLALTLERLERMAERPPQRIGLSATQRPLEEIARFLGGMEAEPETFRPVTIVDCGAVKSMDLKIVSPVDDIGNVGGTVWPAVAALVHDRLKTARTTLVFVNNRAQAERIAAKVNTLANEELALPYHGSLARERRLLLEQRLKAGELRALITTSSLELGIDIGTVDLVIQLQSPKRVAAGLQRVGRAGHTLDATSRGEFVPTFRDDAVEMLAIVRAMGEALVEPTRIVQNALDVLAQVVVAMASMDDWRPDDLFALVRRAYPYHRLPRTAFDEVLAMLSGKYPADLASELEPRITWDRTTDRLSASRGSRMLAVISGGTIPDRGLYTVTLPDRTRLGELDEEFVHESRVGDVFQLGSSTWRIALVEHDRVIVTPAPGAPARMPFWHGEYMARASELSGEVGELRRSFADAGSKADEEDRERAIAALAERYKCDTATAGAVATYMAAQRASSGMVPDERTLLIEEFRDETGAVRLILHSVFGGRVNAPWGMALAQRMREALGGGDVQVQTTDDGIMIRLPDLGMDAPIESLLGLSADEAEHRIVDEVGSTSLFGARFRMNAARALLLPRGSPRRRMPLWLQRLKSLDLLEAVRAFPSFPILVETYRDVIQDAFDLPALRTVLNRIEAGEIDVRIARISLPSPFAASLQFGFVMDWMYGDDTPRAEQRAMAMSLDRAMLDEVMGTTGADEDLLRAIDAMVAERQGVAPGRRARVADELAVLLDRAGDLSAAELESRVAPIDEGLSGDPIEELAGNGRIIQVAIPTGAGREWRWILVETFPRYAAAFGAETLSTVRTGIDAAPRVVADAIPAAFQQPALSPGAARREILARYVAIAGPITVASIRARYDWPERWIEGRLSEWQRTGKLIRGVFRDRTVPEWCSRRIVDIARRRALAALRQQIAPVELDAYVAFLQRWQHLDPRDRRDGPDAAAAAIDQLLGLARPATAWERDYLPARVQGYSPAMLASLAATGSLVWIGGGPVDDRGGPPRLTTIRFVERGAESPWHTPTRSAEALSANARGVLDALAKSGASFVADLQRDTGLGLFALREAIRELVASGMITNDAIESMREVIRLPALPVRPGEDAGDPTRWLPADFTPTRPTVQRRPNIRRLPKWKRPDRPGASNSGWAGRWSIVRTRDASAAPTDDADQAEAVARQWLARYGIVSRDWWRRERPPVGWRAIYRELRRLEYRGEVRRGYFVRGLAGAQFAMPAAVERLRAVSEDPDPPPIVMAASDPANAWALKLDTVPPDPLGRPRGRGALLVTQRGRVILAAEGRVKRLRIDPEASDALVTEAAAALIAHLRSGLVPGIRRRDIQLESIDDRAADASPRLEALMRAGFRRTAGGLRYLMPV